MANHKVRVDKGILGIMFLIVILVVIVLRYAGSTGDVWPDYSVQSDAAEGYSAYYELLSRYKFKVKVQNIPFDQISTSDCQIIVSNYNLDEDEAQDWVRRGGTLVYIDTYKAEDDQEAEVRSLGKGTEIYIADPTLISNKKMLDNIDAAYDLYLKLNEFAKDKKIIFNEYYLYDSEQKVNLWGAMPDIVKALFIQLLFGLILYIGYAGKRFGRVRQLETETERNENEYIYATARLYEQAGTWDLVLNNYFNVLKTKLNKLTGSDEEFTAAWKKAGLKDEKTACEVAQFIQKMSSYDNRKKDHRAQKKEIMVILSKIEMLIKIVDKRREEYWKL